MLSVKAWEPLVGILGFLFNPFPSEVNRVKSKTDKNQWKTEGEGTTFVSRPDSDGDRSKAEETELPPHQNAPAMRSLMV